MIRTLIFDWDGALHNTARLYGCAFRNASEIPERFEKLLSLHFFINKQALNLNRIQGLPLFYDLWNFSENSFCGSSRIMMIPKTIAKDILIAVNPLDNAAFP